MNDDLAPYLGRLPAFIQRAASRGTERLAGLTNRNYLVHHDGEGWVIRIPGTGTSEYIDRRAEAVAARVAADVGVNADLLFFDETDGLMVTHFVEGAVTMSAERFTDLEAIARAGRAFRRLHEAPEPFAVDFGLFAMIDDYKSLLAEKGAVLPDGYDDVVAQAAVVQDALTARPVALVPSHCDPLCENFLDTGDRMFLIDYEYGGNNDPMWDLGDLSVEGGFDAAQDAVLLRAYFEADPPDDQAARMVVYKAMCDLLWTLWGLIQHVNGNPTDDYEAYALGRFGRCRTLMASDQFADALTALRA
jgi:thiamine kinase-like enzyme